MKNKPECCNSCRPTYIEDVINPGERTAVINPMCINDDCPCHTPVYYSGAASVVHDLEWKEGDTTYKTQQEREAFEAGRRQKGSSWREGYEQGLKEGKAATLAEVDETIYLVHPNTSTEADYQDKIRAVLHKLKDGEHITNNK